MEGKQKGLQNPHVKSSVPDMIHRVDWNLIATTGGQGGRQRGRERPPERASERRGDALVERTLPLPSASTSLLEKRKGPGEVGYPREEDKQEPQGLCITNCGSVKKKGGEVKRKGKKRARDQRNAMTTSLTAV